MYRKLSTGQKTFFFMVSALVTLSGIVEEKSYGFAGVAPLLLLIYFQVDNRN
ncbi:hypothetical protein [Caballeronia arvi]|nr:hypothetical protein [Caballeronia arvi]